MRSTERLNVREIALAYDVPPWLIAPELLGDRLWWRFRWLHRKRIRFTMKRDRMMKRIKEFGHKAFMKILHTLGLRNH